MTWLFVLITFLLASVKTTKNENLSVAVVIPAYNEEKTVAEVVNIVKSLNYITEIIVVDDGSGDNTKIKAKEAGAHVIRHETNKGKGSALKTGFKNTTSDIIAFIDADIYNLSKSKVDAIIRPILEGRTDITKTKFARESGRVTELTAKPLINFFFPEIDFEQPLSGQFAGKRSALEKIKFEEDYGVDVGIVLDADIQGIKIEEIDIGSIQHDMSPLADLHVMANEVVRTIINRAVDYGRITMMDTIGNYIRWAVVGLAFIILGVFILFFVSFIPLYISLLIVFTGFVVTIYYLVRLLLRLSKYYKKGSRVTLIKSFINMHFPLLTCAIILVLMLTTFMSAATISDGTISIEPTSRSLIIFPHSENTISPISVRGPYGVDSAIENETNILRFPNDALISMQLSAGDSVKIGNNWYNINISRDNEINTFRIPQEARDILEINTEDVIVNSRLNEVFDGCMISHTSNSSNLTNCYIVTTFVLHVHKSNQTNVEISVENKTIKTFSGSFDIDSTYSIAIGESNKKFNGDFAKNNGVLEFYHNGELYKINFTNPENQSSSKHFINSNMGSFLSFNYL